MAELEYGEVRGRYRLMQSNVTRPAQGEVIFTPIEPDELVDVAAATLTTRERVEATFDGDGWIHAAGAQVDYLPLAVGRWEVAFGRETGLTIAPFQFDVLADEVVNLPAVAPIIPAPAVRFVVNELVYTQTLEARDAAFGARDVALQAAADAVAPTNTVVDARIASKRGAANGVAGLDANGDVPDAQLPERLSPSSLTATIGDTVATSVGVDGSAVDVAFRKRYQTVDPGYDIVIAAGQSNMAGRGVGFTTTTDPVNPRVFQYRSKTPNANTIQPASEPLSMPDSTTGMGPALQFARWYASRSLKTGRKVLIVPVAYGGTGFEASTSAFRWKTTWTPTANNLYLNMITQSKGALSAAAAEMPTGRHEVVAALWCQGETDGDNNITNGVYMADFDALISGLRSELNTPDLPFLILTMVPEYLTTGTRTQIDGVHRDTPLRFARTDVAIGAVAANLGDGNHYSAAGQRLNGRALYDAYERVMQGLSPTFDSIRPGQVTGLAVTSSDSALTATWTPTAKTTTYLVEYRVTGSTGAWSSIVVTSVTASIGSLTNGVQYDVRVVARNGDIAGTTSVAVSGTPFTFTGTTVGLVNAQAQLAYSIARTVNSAYTGPLIRVRRASDNTEQDIAASSGALNTSALTTFANGSDVFVSKIYDQSQRGGRDIAHATLTKQPKIATAGTVLTVGGKPCAVFDGTDDMLFGATAPVYEAGSATSLLVLSAASPPATSRVWAEANSTISGDQYGLSQPDNFNGGGRGRARPVVTTAIVSTDTAYQGQFNSFDGTIHQLSSTDSGTAIAQWRDGAVDLASTAYTRRTRTRSDRFALGGVARNGSESNFGMSFAELVIFGSALATADRQTAESNQKAFYATP